MYTKKKVNKINLILVILCVCLVIACSYVYTLAFFSSKDDGEGTMGMGGPVIVKVADNAGVITSGPALKLTIPAGAVIPGSTITPNVYALMQKSTTTAVLRASISVEVGGVSQQLKEWLEQQLIEDIRSIIDVAWAYNVNDDWFYFLGSPSYSSNNVRIMTQTADQTGFTQPVFGNTFANYQVINSVRNLQANGENTVLASVYSPTQNFNMPFLNTSFQIPFSLTNAYSNATISFYFSLQALQDYLVIDDTSGVILPTIANFKAINERV